VGIGHDHARIDRERLTADQPFLHAARHHSLKQLAQKIAISLYPYYVKSLAQDAADGLTGG
jgi:hypothetical protein